MWLRFDPTTLWHIDAAERAPSTTSDSTKLKVSTKSQVIPQQPTFERILSSAASGPTVVN
jgi:hypothetical protein